uniref:Inositol-1-monophosphatase n=1 Tax=Anthurium amnicola TaxID=1678845 RepID=A0A1D1YU13_9ARAE
MEEYLDFAIPLAKECGQIILEASKRRYSNINKVYAKGGNPSDLVTETDKVVEELIKSKINSKYPDHKFIGEEMTAAGHQCELTDDPTWIIDPIDGTTNFVHGFPYVAVCIGLTINKEPVVGVIFNPFLDQLFTARKGNGAYLNLNTKLPLSHPSPPPTLPSSLSQCLILSEFGSDRSSKTMGKKIQSLRNMISKPGEVTWSKKNAGLVHGIRSLGSAASDIMQVAKGEADMFWEIGCWEWDVTAAFVILREAGGLMANGNGPEGPVDIFGRKYLAIRAGSPCAGDETSEQGQLRLARELWNVVEEIDCPRN